MRRTKRDVLLTTYGILWVYPTIPGCVAQAGDEPYFHYPHYALDSFEIINGIKEGKKSVVSYNKRLLFTIMGRSNGIFNNLLEIDYI